MARLPLTLFFIIVMAWLVPETSQGFVLTPSSLSSLLHKLSARITSKVVFLPSVTSARASTRSLIQLRDSERPSESFESQQQPNNGFDEYCFPFGKCFAIPPVPRFPECNNILIRFSARVPNAPTATAGFGKSMKIQCLKCNISEEGGTTPLEDALIWARVPESDQDAANQLVHLKVPDDTATALRKAGVFVFKDRHTKFQLIRCWWGANGKFTVAAKLPKDPPIQLQVVY